MMIDERERIGVVGGSGVAYRAGRRFKGGDGGDEDGKRTSGKVPLEKTLVSMSVNDASSCPRPRCCASTLAVSGLT